MAFNPQFKINQMAKDMGLKSKELTDLLSDKGIGEVKSQKTLTEQEFNVLFQSLTEANQVDNIYDYMDGKTCIPSKIAAAKAAERAAREAEEETGVKVESVGRLLATTLHGYSFYGKWELKLTAWYQMQGSSAELTPQKEEGIICAEWIGRGEIREKIKTSFPTIRAVFDAFLN